MNSIIICTDDNHSSALSGLLDPSNSFGFILLKCLYRGSYLAMAGCGPLSGPCPQGPCPLPMSIPPISSPPLLAPPLSGLPLLALPFICCYCRVCIIADCCCIIITCSSSLCWMLANMAARFPFWSPTCCSSF